MTMAVAIVNYNTRGHLKTCLETVMAEQPGQVIVVDNASTDGSPEMVAAEYPQADLIAAANDGFGAGANVGIRHASAPYVLLLNSDTRVHRGAVSALTQYLDAHPQVGLAGPRLVNPDGSLQPSAYPTPAPIAELMRWTSLARLAARVPGLGERYLVNWSHDRPASVGWVVGAALAIRKEAFEAIGGFDTSFFMYSEEVDLAYRMQQRGWQTHFTPAATVTHTGGGSTEAYRSDMMARLYLSMHHFYRKHFSVGWQRQLKLIITYFMLRNLVRDRWQLLRGECAGRCEQLVQDEAAWRRVLQATWSS